MPIDFASFLECIPVPVLALDARGVVEFANNALSIVLGRSRNEIVGADWIASFVSQPDRAALRQVSVAAMASGRIERCEYGIVTAAGEIPRFEWTGVVLRDADGAASGLAALAADVTDVRALELTIRENTRERLEIADALRRLEPMPSVEATAAAICDRLIRLSGVDFATVYAFEGPADAIVLAEANSPVPGGTRLPAGWAARLCERATAGPWAELSTNRPPDALWPDRLREARVAAQAFGPITTDGTAVGVLVIGTASPSYATHLVEQLPAIAEFAAISSALLGTALLERRAGLAERLTIQHILSAGRFSPAFQPIVEMGRGHIIGYEALSRFVDGHDPEVLFGTAQRVGLGPALEAATLRAALAASEALPTGPWLGLNVSPEFVLSAELAEILQGRTRPIVIEITEHRAIESYEAVRAAVAALGPDVRIAVDDAGSGMANFSHILGLRPDFVKLDKSLIRALETDVARRALVAGLKYFARTMGIYLIAEGVETAAELAALQSLDVLLGQGYFLGRPTSAAKAPGLRSLIVSTGATLRTAQRSSELS